MREALPRLLLLLPVKTVLLLLQLPAQVGSAPHKFAQKHLVLFAFESACSPPKAHKIGFGVACGAFRLASVHSEDTQSLKTLPGPAHVTCITSLNIWALLPCKALLPLKICMAWCRWV